MTGPPFRNRTQISAMASALERAHQADGAGFNCLLAGFDCGGDRFDRCKNITMFFFRSRMLVDEARAD